VLYQTRDKLLTANPALRVEIEQAGGNASQDSDVVVASVPTLGWRRQPATEKQLERLKRAHLQVPPRISRGQASHLIAMLSHGSS
jgi:uncharacterized glyoxalase superfamily metalloenzyme YdcJ